MLNEVEANIFLNCKGTIFKQNGYVVIDIEGNIDGEHAQTLYASGWSSRWTNQDPITEQWYKKVE